MNEHIDRLVVGIAVVGIAVALVVIGGAILLAISLIVTDPTSSFSLILAAVLIVAAVYGLGWMADR